MKEKWKTIHESYQRSPDGEDLLYDVDEGKGFEKYCDLCPAKIIQSLMEEAMSMDFNPQNLFFYILFLRRCWWDFCYVLPHTGSRVMGIHDLFLPIYQGSRIYYNLPIASKDNPDDR